MPASLEAAAVFAVLIVPGLLVVAGYNRTRAHTLPRRDLYVLAQALAVSLAWLPIVWLLGGRSAIEWLEDDALAGHQSAVLGIVLLNLAAPLATGLLTGLALDRLSERPRLARALGWTGVFSPPTAWEAVWGIALTGEWAVVEIRLKDERTYGVIFDRGSFVGVSPGPRYLFFDTEYRLTDDGDVEILEHEGIFIDATEVESVRLLHVAREDPGE
jgi:hypothetical protein